MRREYSGACFIPGENGQSAGPGCPVDPAWPGSGVCHAHCLIQSTLQSGPWLVSRLLGQAQGLVRMDSQEVRPRCAGAWLAGELAASLFPLGLVARPFSGRSDQMCWEGAPYSHHCTPGVCPSCPGGPGPRWLGLPGRKSRKSCPV